MNFKKPILDIIDFNPKRAIKKGEIKPFIDMASLPVNSRDIIEIGVREFTGGGSKFKNGDTLFARITPCLENGKTAKVNCLPENEYGHGSTEFIVMAAKNPNYDEDYVYYLARLEEFRIYAQSRMEGTSGRQRVAWQSLAEFEFNYPEKEFRKKAGSFLKTIDDKIQINRQLNQTLESIAQAIFKSWFVDFDPVKAKITALDAGGSDHDAELAAMSLISGKNENELAELKKQNADAYNELAQTAALFPSAMQESELGEIPEGWKIACIADICDFQNGYAFKSNEMSKNSERAYKVFKMGGIKKGGGLNKSGTKDFYQKKKCENLSRYIIKKGDLLMCMTDMKNNVALLGHTALMDISDDFILNQRVGLLRTKNNRKANYPFLYILTNSETFIEDLRSRANSGVQVNLSTSEIKCTKFILPNEIVHIAFDKITERTQEQIFSLEAEQEHLIAIRNLLLPKLLSGEIDLSNSENTIKADA